MRPTCAARLRSTRSIGVHRNGSYWLSGFTKKKRHLDSTMCYLQICDIEMPMGTCLHHYAGDLRTQA